MMITRNGRRAGLLLVAVVAAVCFSTPASAAIEDFNEWEPVYDPLHSGFTSSVDSSSQITLNVTTEEGPIPLGTDIGYQTVDGADVASSTNGWAFDPAFDFLVSVDYDLSFDLLSIPAGGFSIGMGIGEDGDGTDSAGIILATDTGLPSGFAAAARVGDVNFAGGPLGPGQMTGRFLVSYEAVTGNVIVGVSTDGDDNPEVAGTFGGLQNLWDNESLLVSFFARGDNGILPFTSGTAAAVFTDFRVISGTPFDVSDPATVPEPSSFAIGLMNLMLLLGFLRYRKR